jgi:hypothetical protein
MSELYKATFPAGSKVRVVDEVALEAFARDWHYHHRLQPEQMGYAGITATVEAGVEDLRQRHRFTEEWGLSETAVPERYGTVA